MCYPCTNCGRCGKFDPNSPLYTPPPSIPCLTCGGTVDASTGTCVDCGDQAFVPTGGMMASANSLRPDAADKEGTDPSESSQVGKGGQTLDSTDSGDAGNKGTDPRDDDRGTDPRDAHPDEDPEEGTAS